jgi:hypothetical protein
MAKGPENAAILAHPFLADMVADTYFPAPLVEKGQRILLDLCANIEAALPASDEAILVLTHQATEAFNDLAEELEEAGSELETAARDAIGTDVGFILETYGFTIDIEEAIAPREW